MNGNVPIMTALIAGLISFLSPCVLPLVPPYLVFLAGTSLERFADAEPEQRVKRETVLAAALFVLGFSTVFVALGASASVIEPFAAFLARFKNYLHRVEQAMGALLVLTGIAFLTGSINQMSVWLLEMFPGLGTIG